MDEKNEKTIMTKDQAVEVVRAALAGTLTGNKYDIDDKIRSAEQVLRLHAVHGDGADPAGLFKRDYDDLHARTQAEIEDRKAHTHLMRALLESHQLAVEMNKRFIIAMEQIAEALARKG